MLACYRVVSTFRVCSPSVSHHHLILNGYDDPVSCRDKTYNVQVITRIITIHSRKEKSYPLRFRPQIYNWLRPEAIPIDCFYFFFIFFPLLKKEEKNSLFL